VRLDTRKEVVLEFVSAKFLNWKCLDNFDRVPDRKVFLVDGEDFFMTPFHRARLRPIFSSLKKKWDRQIKDLFSHPKKTHVEIAGGNYTFFFVLPHAIKWIRNRDRFLPICISLFERGAEVELGDRNIDFLLSGEKLDEPDIEQIKQANKHGYIISRYSYNDAMFFAASKESVSLFGTKDATLQKHNILRYRRYSLNNMYQLSNSLYVPNGREKVASKVVVDQYFLSELLMRKSVGIMDAYASYRGVRSNEIVCLTEAPAAVFKRFIVYRNCMQRYQWLSRSLIKSLQFGACK